MKNDVDFPPLVIKPDFITAMIARIPGFPAREIRDVLDKTGNLAAVNDTQGRKDAAAMVRRLEALKRDIRDHFNPLADVANKFHKAITGQRKAAMELAESESNRVKAQILNFDDAQEQMRKKKAERMAQEARTRAENEMEYRQDRALEQAARLDAQGRHDDAAKILDRAAKEIPGPSVSFQIPDTTPPPAETGLATRQRWTYEIIALGALVDAVQSGHAPPAYVQENPAAIGAAVRSQKNAFSCPGVKVRQIKTLTTIGGAK